MKRLLLLSILCMVFSSGFGQMVCMPDSTLADSSFVLFPLPKSEANPNGGIPDSACVGMPYELTFQFRIPDTIPFGANDLLVSQVAIQNDGIKGLPNGMQYTCNPPDCVFKPDSIISGCLTIFGTPDDTTGNYSLSLAVTITSNLGPFPLTLPSDAVEGANGTYDLTVMGADSEFCMRLGSEDVLSTFVQMKNVPNPFRGLTQIQLNSTISSDMNFEVFDLLGKQVHREKIRVAEGSNTIEYDANHLADGIYIYSISNQDGRISSKMVISRQ